MPSLTQWTWVWVSSGRRWRQGSLAYCSTWGHKELDMTEQLNKQQQYNFNVFKKYLVYLKLPVPFLTAPISPSVTSVQSLSCVWLFATPWTAALQASLSITNSWSLLKLMSIESVMASNHLILCHPLILLPSIFPSIRVFSNKSTLHIRWPKYWSFSLGLTGLISLQFKGLSESSPTPQFTDV